MKKIGLLLATILFTLILSAQDQTVNGNLAITGNLKTSGYLHLSGARQLTINPNDNFIYDDKSMGHYGIAWVHDSWHGTPTLWLTSYGGIKMFLKGVPVFVINNYGNVGIGTDNPQSKLDVRGKIIADEVEIKVNKGADFVFEPDYKLPALSEVETFVKDNKHLPDIPSENEMIENGVNVNEMQIKLLQKIEELTLYTIQLEKKYNDLKEEVKELKKENN